MRLSVIAKLPRTAGIRISSADSRPPPHRKKSVHRYFAQDRDTSRLLPGRFYTTKAHSRRADRYTNCPRLKKSRRRVL